MIQRYLPHKRFSENAQCRLQLSHDKTGVRAENGFESRAKGDREARFSSIAVIKTSADIEIHMKIKIGRHFSLKQFNVYFHILEPRTTVTTIYFTYITPPEFQYNAYKRKDAQFV